MPCTLEPTLCRARIIWKNAHCVVADMSGYNGAEHSQYGEQDSSVRHRNLHDKLYSRPTARSSPFLTAVGEGGAGVRLDRNERSSLADADIRSIFLRFFQGLAVRSRQLMSIVLNFAIQTPLTFFKRMTRQELTKAVLPLLRGC
jgi:hypothetical protein